MTSAEINALPEEERRAYFVARDKRFNASPSKKAWRDANKARKCSAHKALRERDLEYYRQKNRVWMKRKNGVPLSNGKHDDSGFIPRGKKRSARRPTHAEYQAERKKKDPNFKLAINLRCRVNVALRNQYGRKAARTIQTLGCTIPELRCHLESLWKPGMSWDNYGRGGWHIDHIKPCSAFDLTTLEGQQACFHYTNLQPLWEAENLKKGASLNGMN